MANPTIEQIKVGSTTYDIVDATARTNAASGVTANTWVNGTGKKRILLNYNNLSSSYDTDAVRANAEKNWYCGKGGHLTVTWSTRSYKRSSGTTLEANATNSDGSTTVLSSTATTSYIILGMGYWFAHYQINDNKSITSGSLFFGVTDIIENGNAPSSTQKASEKWRTSRTGIPATYYVASSGPISYIWTNSKIKSVNSWGIYHSVQAPLASATTMTYAGLDIKLLYFGQV